MSELINDENYNELDEFNNSFSFGGKKPRPVRREKKPILKRNITIYDYIAETRPADSHFIINKYGKYRRARNKEELAYQLKDFVRTFGDKGLKELAKIHPDRELVEIECRGCAEHKRSKPVIEVKERPEKEKIIYHNASGDGGREKGTDNKILIFGGMLLLAVAILMRK